MPRCPTCAQVLFSTDIECPRCRPSGLRVGFDVGQLLQNVLDENPLYGEAMELIERLEVIAPAVRRWQQLDRETRGPIPDTHPKHRDEVAAIIDRMRVIARQLRTP